MQQELQQQEVERQRDLEEHHYRQQMQEMRLQRDLRTWEMGGQQHQAAETETVRRRTK